jgi:UDP-N-acetylglucosamine 2-epimerase (non-hydrolysing)
MDEGTLIMCGLKAVNVLQAIDVTVAHYEQGERPFRLLPDYDTVNVSRKVLKVILSYTDYVNRTVWHKA